MPATFDLIDVNSSNLQQTGFFCYMSKPKTPGYQHKRAWLEGCFSEGLKLKIIHEHGGRKTAFIEYIFDDSPAPSFPQDWENRLAAFGPGMTVVHTPQCPYTDDAILSTMKLAAENGIPARHVELATAQDVQAHAPCAYGTFSIVLDESCSRTFTWGGRISTNG